MCARRYMSAYGRPLGCCCPPIHARAPCHSRNPAGCCLCATADLRRPLGALCGRRTARAEVPALCPNLPQPTCAIVDGASTVTATAGSAAAGPWAGRWRRPLPPHPARRPPAARPPAHPCRTLYGGVRACTNSQQSEGVPLGRLVAAPAPPHPARRPPPARPPPAPVVRCTAGYVRVRLSSRAREFGLVV